MKKMFKIIGIYVLIAFVISMMPFVRPKALSTELEARKDTILTTQHQENERVSLISDPFDAFEARMAMIDSAQDSLYITSYIAHSGESTDEMIAALYRAADRGVDISLVFDSKMGGMKGSRAKALSAHPNIQVYHYNPLKLLQPFKLQAVFHEKYFLVDEHILVLGGRNLGDKYYNPPGFSGSVSYDYDLFVYNETPTKLFKDIKNHHLSLLAHKDVKAVKGSKDNNRPVVDYQAYNLEGFISKSVPVDSIQFISDPLEPADSSALIASVIQGLLLQANDEVLLQSPYMTHHKALFKTLHKVKSASVPVSILTNSISSSPNFPAYSAYYSNKKPFIESVTGLYEYQSEGGNDSIHGKAYLFDNKLMLGSINLDHRSYYINPETVLLVEGDEIASVFKEEFFNKLEKSYAVKQGPYKAGLDEAKEASLLKRILTRLSAPLFRLFKFLI